MKKQFSLSTDNRLISFILSVNYMVAGHSIHFQVGGDNPKVEGKEFF